MQFDLPLSLKHDAMKTQRISGGKVPRTLSLDTN